MDLLLLLLLLNNDVGVVVLPWSSTGHFAVRWLHLLGERAADGDRFSRSIVHTLLSGLLRFRPWRLLGRCTQRFSL